MDTYGDMVTLLLCFFVLLYASSSIDQVKWENLVQSLNPQAKELTQVVTDKTLEPGEDDVPGSIKEPEEISPEISFNEIAQMLQEAVNEQGLQDDIQITQGDGFTFLNFKDMIFFDGDSPVLREEGKPILESLGALLGNMDASIQEVDVLGHTSQASPDIPNEVHTDRVLSSQRAAEVVSYLQQNSALQPSKLVSMGYGQFRPIAPFDTGESRAKNRRVEILITENGATKKSLDEYYTQVYQTETDTN